MTGLRRKILIFTEPRDTLEYLQQKIAARIGDSSAVVVIHGGIAREARRAAIAAFNSDPVVRVMIANDAAGEGVNLQRAIAWGLGEEKAFGAVACVSQRRGVGNVQGAARCEAIARHLCFECRARPDLWRCGYLRGCSKDASTRDFRRLGPPCNNCALCRPSVPIGFL